MKLTVEGADFKAALGRLDKVVPRADTIPILNHIHATAVGDELILRATDMDVTLVCRVPAEVEASGTAAIPGVLLRALARAAPDGAQIALKSQAGGGAILARAGTSRFRLPVLPPEDFPAEPAIDEGAEFTLPGVEFLAAMARIASGIGVEETRYYLNGVFFHACEGALRLVATDGHTLFQALLPWPEGLDPDGEGAPAILAYSAADRGGVLVPLKTVTLLPACFSSAAEIEVSVNSSLIGFTAGGTRLISKLIDATFPDYERVIPKDGGERVALPREAVLRALSGVSGFQAGSKSRGMSLRIAGDRLIMAVTDEYGALAVQEVEVAWAGERFDVGVNSGYLREVLSSRPSKSVDLVWSKDNTQGPLRILDADLPGEVAVIMPMRVQFPAVLIENLDALESAP